MEVKFVNEGDILVVHYPFEGGFWAWRVVSRYHKGANRFNYGVAPVNNYIVPPYGFTTEFKFTFGRLPPEKAPDMFYFEDTNKLIHAYIKFHPSPPLKAFMCLPEVQPAQAFRGVVADPARDDDFGFFRWIELIVPPKLHISFRLSNGSNMTLVPYVEMHVEEYKVRKVTDLEVLKSIADRKVKAYEWTIPSLQKLPDECLAILGSPYVKGE